MAAMERRAAPWRTRERAATFEDHRGKLTVVPFDKLPFVPARVYVISELAAGKRRGGHASRSQHKFLVGLSGRAKVELDDGRHCELIELCPADTVHVPPGTWLEIEGLAEEASILVLADGLYDPGDHFSDRSLLRTESRSASHTADA